MNFIKNLFSKNKTIYLDAYTNDSLVHKYFPIQESSFYIPEWWKKIPAKVYEENAPIHSDGFELPTMKKCPGFIELFKKSFSYPLWSDLELIMNGDEEKTYSYRFGFDNEFDISTHGAHEYGEFLSKGDFVHIKLMSPWFVEASENIDWAIMPAMWNYGENMSRVFVVPGIDNYLFNHSTTWQMFVENKEQVINLSAGTPLVHMIPITERKVEVRSHLDSQKYQDLKRSTSAFSFTNNYYTKKRLLEKHS